jgi:hypothetical protein
MLRSTLTLTTGPRRLVACLRHAVGDAGTITNHYIARPQFFVERCDFEMR